MTLFKYFFLILCFAFVFKASTQPPFYDEIRDFKKQDSIKQPPDHAILFTGSSSFAMWQDVQSYFPDYTIINRGFGGSSLPDVIRYVDEIIFSYHPKQVVIYCGENDFASDSTITADTVFNRFKTLYKMIRAKMSTAPVAFVSIKPSPSRRKYWRKMIEANILIRNYLAGERNTAYIDVFNPMLNENNQPKPEIFLSDSLHMNAKGYAIWQKAIQPHLVK